MNKNRNLITSILFVLFVTVATGFLSMFVSRFFIPKDAGLAGGAMVLMWGLAGTLIGLLASIFTVKRVSPIWLKRATLVLGVVSICCILWMVVRIRHSNQQSARQIEEMKHFNKTSSVATGEEPDSNYDPLLGFGIAKLVIDDSRPVYFYNTSVGKAKVDSLVFSKSIHNQFELTHSPEHFTPFHLKVDYEVCFLRVLEAEADKLHVVIDEANSKSMWMFADVANLVSWPEFVLSISDIEPKDRENNPLRESPQRHSNPIQVPEDFQFLIPLSIKEEWVEVQLIGSDDNKLGLAWIRWYDNSGLLIKYSLFM